MRIKLKGRPQLSVGSIKVDKAYKVEWHMSSKTAPIEMKLPDDYQPTMHRKSLHLNIEKLEQLLEPDEI